MIKKNPQRVSKIFMESITMRSVGSIIHVGLPNPWFVNSPIKINGGRKWRYYAGTQLCNYFKLNVIWYVHSARPTRMFRPLGSAWKRFSTAAESRVHRNI